MILKKLGMGYGRPSKQVRFFRQQVWGTREGAFPAISHLWLEAKNGRRERRKK